jgi:cytochrome P450
MRETLLARRENPRDDLISLLWQSQIEGVPTTLDDMENYAVLLFIAGLDTVMNGMGFGIRHLARDAALQAELRGNPRLIPEAAEELLRRYTFTVPPRRVGKDTVFEGLQMKEGERVMLFLPAADLDSKEFPDAERFDLAREKKPHIAFNVGPHRCLGSHLARLELRLAVEEICRSMPDFEITPGAEVERSMGMIKNFDSLPLTVH